MIQNKFKEKTKLKGFTLIEVSLFVALSGLLAAGVIMGTANQISQQRYADVVNNFEEFLRSVYSEVDNVEGNPSGGNGRSDEIIIGKMLAVGDATRLNNTDLSESDERAYTYTVVGKNTPTNNSACNSYTGIQKELCSIEAHLDKDSASSYFTTYGGKIQSTAKNTGFKGMILIVRSPSTGVIYTLYNSQDQVNINERLKSSAGDYKLASDTNLSHFTSNRNIDFCLFYDASLYNGKRRDIRILSGAKNETGIIEVELDGGDNQCE